MDTNTLLVRLRAAAAQYADANQPVWGEARPWSSGKHVGVRQALLETMANCPHLTVGQFVSMDDADFVHVAFLLTWGREPDDTSRHHYLRALKEGTPRVEVLTELAASEEGLTNPVPPRWPLWLRALLLGLRAPSPFVRRATRAVLRRIERRLGRRRSRNSERMLWRLAAAVDRLSRELTTSTESASNELIALRARLAVIDYAASQAKAGNGTQGPAEPIDAVTAESCSFSANTSAVQIGAPITWGSNELDSEITRYYMTLESVFRGVPERIRDQLERDYLPLLIDAQSRAGDGPAVDLGCGRGEWLDVLEAHGFSATGVDANPFMTAAARERGQQVVHGDALAYLGSLPDDSLLAVTAFHLIEHLPFSSLFRMVAECRRVLKPEGILILETPNPENILVATHTFHHDPTHGQPLTPSSLEFLVNHHGLQTVHLLRLHPYPETARLPGHDPASERLNGMTCCGQDFAIVAKKVMPG